MNRALFVFLESTQEKTNIQELLGAGIPVEGKHVCLAAGLDQLPEKLRQQHPLFIFIKEAEQRGTSKRDDPYTCVLHDIAVYNKRKRVPSKVIIYGINSEPKTKVEGVEYFPIDRIPLVLNLS